MAIGGPGDWLSLRWRVEGPSRKLRAHKHNFNLSKQWANLGGQVGGGQIRLSEKWYHGLSSSLPPLIPAAAFKRFARLNILTFVSVVMPSSGSSELVTNATMKHLASLLMIYQHVQFSVMQMASIRTKMSFDIEMLRQIWLSMMTSDQQENNFGAIGYSQKNHLRLKCSHFQIVRI